MSLAPGNLVVVVTNATTGKPIVGTVAIFGPEPQLSPGANTDDTGTARFNGLYPATYYIIMYNVFVGATVPLYYIAGGQLLHVLGEVSIASGQTSYVYLAITPPTTQNPNGGVSETQGSGPTPPPPPPPSGTNPPPPPPTSQCTPPASGNYNPVDWLAYLACILSNIWVNFISAVNTAWAATLTALWAALSPSWQANIKGFLNFWANSGTWLSQFVDSLFVSKSVPIAQRLAQGSASTSNNVIANILKSLDAPFQSIQDLLDQVTALGTQIGDMVSEPTDTNSVKVRVTELDTLVTKLYLAITVAQTTMEDIPTLNKTGSARMMLAYTEARGILQVIRGTLDPFLQANINKEMVYALSAQYHNTVPDLGTLIRLLHTGRLVDESYKALGMQVSGISSDFLEIVAAAALAEPTIDDIANYNVHNPNTPIDPKTIWGTLGLDGDRYSGVFLERQYTDLNVLFGRTLSDLGTLDTEALKRLAIQNRYRDYPNIHTEISDTDLVVQAIQGRTDLVYYRQALSSARRKFIDGVGTLQDLTATAQLYIKNDTARAAFLSAAQDLKAATDAENKTLPDSIMTTLLAAGAMQTNDVQSQLAGTRYTPEQQTWITNYITTNAQTKALTLKRAAAKAAIGIDKTFTVTQLAESWADGAIDVDFVLADLNKYPYDILHKQALYKQVVKKAQGIAAKAKTEFQAPEIDYLSYPWVDFS